MERYEGTIDKPWPHAAHDGWTPAGTDDARAVALARELAPSLPAWHKAQRLEAEGLYTVFAYETPTGHAVGAMRFVGTGADALARAPSFGAVEPPPFPDPPPIPIPPLPIPPGGIPGNEGGNSPEPFPEADGSCGAWTPDASNAKAVAVATAISYHNDPVPWTDGQIYRTNIDGTPWAFPMWQEDGKRMVSAFRCTKGGTGTSSGGGSTLALVLGGVVAAVGLTGIGLALAGR